MFQTSLTHLELTTLIESCIKTCLAENYLQKETEPKDYLTRGEVASLLGVTLSTIHSYTVQGRLKAHRIGSRVRYKSSEIEEALLSVRKHQRQ